MQISKELVSMGKSAKIAGKTLANTSTSKRNTILKNVIAGLKRNKEKLLQANQIDLINGSQNGLGLEILDRLELNSSRLDGLASDIQNLIQLPDILGEEFESKELENGLLLSKRRVPLGVIGAIYESRPNVTIDIASICIKSGNSCILRGGKESINTNKALVDIISMALIDADCPPEAVQFIESTDRNLVGQMLSMKDYIDLIIPRGGSTLVNYVNETALMPAITGGIGVCHTYIDSPTNIDDAVEIVYNAKVQRPSVCNALDTILVNHEVAKTFLPLVSEKLADKGVELRCDEPSLSIISPLELPNISKAKESDWGQEFLDLILSVKIVDSIDEALKHIEQYGSGHTEAILTENDVNANKFLNLVDSSAVFVNASTRLNDGGQFGLGAEVAISTSKFHARGPMGLEALMSYKWIGKGSGQIRN
ncbi:MAG: glutamate-5-semialdehyde dehydrogenase [Chloroflexi bacterium]|nr:glutamate-5-semialdehyde dehydrogenase [Chloroflexota bacterium]|tara:strand:- start:4339 stop:5610 length:1272 start_codon:yes stop_codon:yes gene_type:complete